MTTPVSTSSTPTTQSNPTPTPTNPTQQTQSTSAAKPVKPIDTDSLDLDGPSKENACAKATGNDCKAPQEKVTVKPILEAEVKEKQLQANIGARASKGNTYVEGKQGVSVDEKLNVEKGKTSVTIGNDDRENGGHDVSVTAEKGKGQDKAVRAKFGHGTEDSPVQVDAEVMAGKTEKGNDKAGGEITMQANGENGYVKGKVKIEAGDNKAEIEASGEAGNDEQAVKVSYNKEDTAEGEDVKVKVEYLRKAKKGKPESSIYLQTSNDGTEVGGKFKIPVAKIPQSQSNINLVLEGGVNLNTGNTQGNVGVEVKF